jgi:hypothetical protein
MIRNDGFKLKDLFFQQPVTLTYYYNNLNNIKGKLIISYFKTFAQCGEILIPQTNLLYCLFSMQNS